MADGTEKRSLPLLGTGVDATLARLAVGDSAAIIAELKLATEQSPDDATHWLRLGTAFAAIAHPAEAASAYARAIALDDEDVELRILYADALGRNGHHDQAAFQLVQARRLAPDDARVHRQLGVAFFDKGLFDKAIHSLALACSLDGADARTHFVIGLVHDARRDPAQAIVAYRRAVALDAAMLDARCTLADALAAVGELHEALRELEIAQRLERTNTRIARNLEVLRHALAELSLRRLLGKSESIVGRSALVEKGKLARRGLIDTELGSFIRFEGAALELWAHFDDDASHVLDRVVLVLCDPEHALRVPDDVFGVTVLSRDGASERADLATGASLAFLREVLGCPLTQASAIYAELVASAAPIERSGARLGFQPLSFEGRSHVGLSATVLDETTR
ncbi:MAG: hypothetical protein EXR75_00155 [Myxococcales bacterium]|nr:hypothetical protein [Myxococcales bacterium]